MSQLDDFCSSSPPLVIGGVGGSGTRLITQCLRKIGYAMGTDLNTANDNLWYTLLFKRIEILAASKEDFDELLDVLLIALTGLGTFTPNQIKLINALAKEGRPQHSSAWLKQRADSLLLKSPEAGTHARWGWKEPNSHILLDRLIDRLENFKYIHVIRNGLDMAYSKNQNQLNLWGAHFLQENFTPTPYYSLRYWRITHQRVLDIGKSMGNDFMLLNYDDFCSNSSDGIAQLCDFIGLPAKDVEAQIINLIKPPQSIGRFKKHNIHQQLSIEDIEYAEHLGFDVSTI